MQLVDRPREQLREWRILSPTEIAAVEAAFVDLLHATSNDRDRDDTATVRRMFVVHIATGLRRSEIAGLRWRYVRLTDPEGAFLRVAETFVRHGRDTPKSRAGQRTVDLGRRTSDVLFEQRVSSAFDGDDEFVFPNPRTGRPFDAQRYADLMRAALIQAGITEYVRPSHDLRHTSITNGARAGTSPEALMNRAGHSSYATTRRYINLAGARFSEEADRLEQRIWGTSNRLGPLKMPTAPEPRVDCPTGAATTATAVPLST